MRLAIIDLGTNSVRFDVVEVGERGELVKLHREKLMIRLGEKVFLRRRLDPHSISVCLDAFESFARTIRDFKPKRVVAFGTSALREARDGERLIAKIKQRAGISVRIISGDEEARLIARGVLKNEAVLRGRFALVDIGGGSTEVSICSGRKVLCGASFALGTARLQQLFLKTIPPEVGSSKNGSDVEPLRRHIRGLLLYRLVSEDWPKVNRVLGSSGTIRALSRISKKETGSSIIHRPYLDDLVRRMMTMKREELLSISGMESRRVDMILAGGILLQECMSAVHAKTAELTEFSLRDGILDEQLELLRRDRSHERRHLVYDFLAVASRLGGDSEELRQAVRISEDLFEKLKPVHALTDSWKDYVTLAAVFQGVGRSISSKNYEDHSAYIAKYVDAMGLQTWERKLISELCKRHRGARFLKREIAFHENQRLQRNFYKLLSLLRISVALSNQRSRPIVLEGIRVKGSVVNLLISKRYAPDLAVLRADQKKSLFEEVFRKRLNLEWV